MNDRSTRRQLVDAAILAAAGFTPLLPGAYAPAALLVVCLLWTATRPPRRELLIGVTLLAAAFVCLALEAGAPAELWSGEERLQADLEARYEAQWSSLSAAADSAREALESGSLVAPSSREDRLRAYLALQGVVDSSVDDVTLKLLDVDGEALAWAGPGLLNSLAAELPSTAGASYRQSFSATTFLVSLPLGGGSRSSWVIAGRSYAHADNPVVHRGDPIRYFPARWRLVAPDAAGGGDEIRLAASGFPTLLLRPQIGVDELSGWRLSSFDLRRKGALVLTVLLLYLAVSRGLGSLLSGAGVERSTVVTVLLIGAAVSLGSGFGLSWVVTTALAVGLGVAWLGLTGRAVTRSSWAAVGRGTGAAGLVLALAFAYQGEFGPLDLSASLSGSAHVLAVRAVLLGVALGFLGRLRGEGAATGFGGSLWLWVGTAGLIFGAAVPDRPIWAIGLLVTGTGAAAFGLLESFDRRNPARPVWLMLLATVLAAGSSEVAYRQRMVRHIDEELLPGLAPPNDSEKLRVREIVTDYLSAPNLDWLGERRVAEIETQDAAYALWWSSPLNRRGILSALTVDIPGHRRSTFSFGIPMESGGIADRDPVSWADLELPVWREAFVSGVHTVRFDPDTLATVRYWVMPRPGVRLGGRLRDLAVSLLRGGPTTLQPVQGELEPAVYALYEADGTALITPWVEAPLLDAGLIEGGQAVVATPTGTARAFARTDSDGVEVVFLPRLSAAAALERAGNYAASMLLLVGGLTLVALLLELPRARFRVLVRRTVRSYSRRLILVYTVLLLVPLLLLNFLVLRDLSQRFTAEQLSDGEAALDSAQHVLGEYILALEPGFGVETALDDELLLWLSRVIGREVNLYWGNNLYASSQPELFTAGLLPDTIPGEIHSRLTLLGQQQAVRTSRAGETRYLEIYAPLRIPGVPPQEKLVMSIPLLAAQEETAAQFASLRRRALLLTGSLVLLMFGVGARLAESFTRPLQELVHGTRRIARGEASLGLAPRELELAELVEAIDQMAARIAEGRERLMREKQVVERMVDNITSGVVSLDDQGRVLLRNRVATALLGVEPGRSVVQSLAGSERLAPVLEFVEQSGAEVRQQTVALAHEGGGESRDWNLVWVPVPGSVAPAALLVVEDATEFLRGQRLLAWAEMARMIAHEIKNPLTPVRLSVEHMQDVYAEDPERFEQVFERCTANILAQVEELRQIAGEFSTYSRIPEIDRQPDDLVDVVEEIVGGYRAAPPPGVTIELVSTLAELPMRLDRRMLGRALRNLIENALRACSEGGAVTVSLDAESDGARARVRVADTGPGVPAEHLTRIFDPYFSTHSSGTGLGLPISRRIVEEHGGEIAARNRNGGGLEVCVELPVQIDGAPTRDLATSTPTLADTT